MAAGLSRNQATLDKLHRILGQCTTITELRPAVENLLQLHSGVPDSLYLLALSACARVARKPKDPSTQPLEADWLDLRYSQSRDMTCRRQAVLQLAEDIFVQARARNQPGSLKVWQGLLQVYTATGCHPQSLHLLTSFRQQGHQLTLPLAMELVRATCAANRYNLTPGIISQLDQTLKDQTTWSRIIRVSTAGLVLFMLAKWSTLFLKFYVHFSMPAPETFAMLFVYLLLAQFHFYGMMASKHGPKAFSERRPMTDAQRARAERQMDERIPGGTPIVVLLFAWAKIPNQPAPSYVADLYKTALYALTEFHHFKAIPAALTDIAAMNLGLSQKLVRQLLHQAAVHADMADFWGTLVQLSGTPLEHGVFQGTALWDDLYRTIYYKRLYDTDRTTLLLHLNDWLRSKGVPPSPTQTLLLMQAYRDLGLLDQAHALWTQCTQSYRALISQKLFVVYADVLLGASQWEQVPDLYDWVCEPLTFAQRRQLTMTLLSLHAREGQRRQQPHGKVAPSTASRSLVPLALLNSSQGSAKDLYACAMLWFEKALAFTDTADGYRATAYAYMMSLGCYLQLFPAVCSLYADYHDAWPYPYIAPDQTLVNNPLDRVLAPSPSASAPNLPLSRLAITHPEAVIRHQTTVALSHTAPGPQAMVAITQHSVALLRRPTAPDMSPATSLTDQVPLSSTDNPLLQDMIALTKAKATACHVSLDAKQHRWQAQADKSKQRQRNRDLATELAF
ncbi:hypothetical protein H4R34_005347 [Dimargaris verticillata]|uniref:Uncharacterized protein n=1 Tax=Dimargaris verticillata TaxID=2761393 RepID=A0A9W8AYD2_9FUNG|nr:hypothetical protein H4R34_005347 [Dimargaris verticillata]